MRYLYKFKNYAFISSLFGNLNLMYLIILCLVLFQVDNYYDKSKKEERPGEYRTLRRYTI
jgi:hypothetical protein